MAFAMSVGASMIATIAVMSSAIMIVGGTLWSSTTTIRALLHC